MNTTLDRSADEAADNEYGTGPARIYGPILGCSGCHGDRETRYSLDFLNLWAGALILMCAECSEVLWREVQ